MSVLILLKNVPNGTYLLLSVSPANKGTYYKELNVSNVKMDAMTV